jgi:hypothetical protein
MMRLKAIDFKINRVVGRVFYRFFAAKATLKHKQHHNLHRRHKTRRSSKKSQRPHDTVEATKDSKLTKPWMIGEFAVLDADIENSLSQAKGW